MNMKTQMKMIGILALVSATPALAQQLGDADEVTKVMNAQIQVTRDNLANLQKQIGLLSGNPYDDASYMPLSDAFKKSIDAALARFDKKMSTIVLPKAQYWLNRHIALIKTIGNTVEHSDNTVSQLKMVSKEYQKAIRDLYQEVAGEIAINGSLRIRQIPNAPVEYCGPVDKEFKKNVEKGRGWTKSGVLETTLKSWNTEWTLDSSYCLTWNEYPRYLFQNRQPRTADFFRDFEPHKPWIYPATESSKFSELVVVPAVSNWVTSTYRNAAEIPADIAPGRLMQNKISEIWGKDCETTRCRQLRYSDLLQFVTLVNATIDKDIAFDQIPAYVRRAYYDTASSTYQLIAPHISVDALLGAIRDLIENTQ
jgi:hypothetical protein